MRSRRRSVRWALPLVFALVAAACGGDDGDSAGSGSGSGSGASSEGGSSGGGPSEGAGFPVTIEHAFGETTIEEAPERVVTYGWGSADAAIALGVVPVAIPFEQYGGDDEGVLPWIRDELDALGAETPEVIEHPDDGPALEAVAAVQPDLILAPYSGVTEDQYELLAQIAPTVAYPEEAWSTPWRDVIDIVGRSLGLEDEAGEIVADIDAQVAEQAEAQPELEGKTVAQVWDTPDTFYVYKPADPRVEFTEDLGLVTAPSVDELSGGDETFYYELSRERLDELESDILVSYADTQEQQDTFLASEPAALLGQVERGTVAEVVGTEFIAAVSPPTALSLTWGLEDYVAILSDAATTVDDG